jgi:hypothetical protein
MRKLLLCVLSVVSLHVGAQEYYCDDCCSDPSGPYISASYLYWYSKLEELPIVIQGDLSEGSNDSLQEMTFDWNSGFKLGVGYNLPSNQWDVCANWTHIRPEAHGHFHVGSGPSDIMGAVLADGLLQGNQIVIIVSNEAKAHWHLDFNTLDLELGKNLYLGRDFTLRPFAGLKLGTLTQKFHVEYHDNVEIDVVTYPEGFPFDLTTQDFKIRDYVIGPRIGFDSRWNICGSSFAVLANGSVSLLWNESKFDNLGTVQDVNPNNNRHDVFKTKVKYMEPVFEAFLGFDWHWCICENYSLDLGAGYEMQLWLNQTQTPFGANSGIANERNISLQGLTASARFSF